MFFKFISAYLRHRFTAKTRHGTHSPFIYKLVDEVIYDFSHKKVYIEVEEQRKKLLNDDTKIAVFVPPNEFAAVEPNEVRISKMAKDSLKSVRLDQLIFRLVLAQRPKNAITLDATLGITTAYITKACPEGNLTAIENTTPLVVITNKDALGLQNIKLQTGNPTECLKSALTDIDYLGVFYMGGKRAKAFILDCFRLCLPKIDEHSFLIFDQPHWNADAEQAWAIIKNHDEVTVTIDLFWIGLVYFKKGQAKEHFKIRF